MVIGVGRREAGSPAQLEARALETGYAPPSDFDPTEYVSDGRVFRSDAEEDVLVRYSPRVAPWVREHGPIEELDGGSVSVRFTTADPRWVVRHVLLYGPEAEVVEPPAVREAIKRFVDLDQRAVETYGEIL